MFGSGKRVLYVFHLDVLGIQQKAWPREATSSLRFFSLEAKSETWLPLRFRSSTLSSGF